MNIQRTFIAACLFLATELALAATGSIDATAKFVWSENAGWINFSSTDSSVSVTRDFLSGYAWCETAGWIKLGSGTGPFPNSTRANWGVNVAYSANVPGGGALSGYAWGENSGWINFAPKNGGVIVGADGAFDGFAWSETLGWIHFDKASAVSVKTAPFNNAPVLQSAPIAIPWSSTNIGQAAMFTVSAFDPDGDALTYTWDFGDGSTDTGASVTHTYTTPGNYTATVIISDGVSSIPGTVNLVVTTPFTVSKAALKFIFNKPGADSLMLYGTISLPVGFAPAGMPVSVTIVGLNRSFTLNAKGKSGAAFKLGGRFKNGALVSPGAKFQLALTKQSLPVTIFVGVSGYHADKPVIYNAKAGTSGTAK